MSHSGSQADGPLHMVTPTIRSFPISAHAGYDVFLKLDNLQIPGSFKIRGIGNLMKKASQQGCKKVVCASGGNAGLAAAYGAKMMGLPATIVLPQSTPAFVADKLRNEFGAEVEIVGKVWDESNAYAINLAKQPDILYVHPFDHPDIWKVKPRAYAVPEQPDRDPVHLYKLYADKRPVDMMTEDSPFFLTPGNKTQQCWFRKSAMGINKLYSIMTEMKTDAGIQEPRITPYREGHSTLIEEAAKQLPCKPDVVIVSVGGGGLLNGLFMGMQKVGWGSVPCVAMETRGADSFNAAVKNGKLVTLPDITSVAKCLGALTVSAKSLELAQQYQNIHSVVINDAKAVDACLKFADDHRYLVEPACGASLAAVYGDVIKGLQKEGKLGEVKTALVVVCGGSSVTLKQLETWRDMFHL